jgi:hypothetical protein
MTTVVHSALTGTRAQDAARTVQTPDAADVSGLDQRKHAAPWPVLLRVCTSRMFKVEFARNWEACAIRWCLALFIGLVTGVLFLQLPTTFPVCCPLHPAPSTHPPCAALANGLAGASHRTDDDDALSSLLPPTPLHVVALILLPVTKPWQSPSYIPSNVTTPLCFTHPCCT